MRGRDHHPGADVEVPSGEVEEGGRHGAAVHALGAALGVPIGSGPVETLCSQFQNRLKRTGQFGTKTGFAALLQVTVRLWNGEMDSLWPLAA